MSREVETVMNQGASATSSSLNEWKDRMGRQDVKLKELEKEEGSLKSDLKELKSKLSST